MAGHAVGWRRSRFGARDPALDRDPLARIAEQALRHRHVRAEVVVQVEAAAGGVGVEDVEVDHFIIKVEANSVSIFLIRD